MVNEGNYYKQLAFTFHVNILLIILFFCFKYRLWFIFKQIE